LLTRFRAISARPDLLSGAPFAPQQTRVRQAQRQQSVVKKVDTGQSRHDKNRIHELERQLRRKDAALAETAAFQVLRKKLNAYWGGGSEDEGN
jgi:hypothetical protein